MQAELKHLDVKPPVATLGQFIEEHSKLVTSMAAFIALTAFASQLSDADVGPIFSALTFMAAALLGFELLMKLPPPPRHWRLETFSYVLSLLVILMGWYWFSNFPGLWLSLVFFLIELVLLVGAAALLTYLLTAAVGLVATKLFKSSIRPVVFLRISKAGFVFCAILVFAGLLWASKKLSGHTINIHLSNTPSRIR
jgi:hypothetical protein